MQDQYDRKTREDRELTTPQQSINAISALGAAVPEDTSSDHATKIPAIIEGKVWTLLSPIFSASNLGSIISLFIFRIEANSQRRRL